MEQLGTRVGYGKSAAKFIQKSCFAVFTVMIFGLAANAQEMPGFARYVNYTLPCLENGQTPGSSTGQQTDKAKDSQTTDAAEKKEDKKEPGDEKEAIKVNMITDGGTASSANYKPLTNHQRWQFYLAQNFTTAGAYLGVFFSAGLDQLGNNPARWGQGAEGYGRRVASRFGANVVQGTIQSSGAWLLKEDPRYVRSDKKGFLPRAAHALSYGVLTYNNQGHTTIAFANITSYYASSMVSTVWLPDVHRVVPYGLEDGSEQLALGTAFNLVEEFWPEITHILKFK